MWVRSLDQEDPLEEDTAPHSSILAGRIPWTEAPRGLQFIGSHRVRHDCSDLARTCTHPKSGWSMGSRTSRVQLPAKPHPPYCSRASVCACTHTHTHTDVHTDTETNGLRYTETHLQHPRTHT